MSALPKLCPHGIAYEECPSIACQTRRSLAAMPGSGHVEVKTQEAQIGDEFWMGGKLSRWIAIETRAQQIGVSISGYLVRRKASGQNDPDQRPAD